MSATRRTKFEPGDIALIAVFAALIAVLALVPAISVGVGVPITLQTLGVTLAGLTLGPLRGLLAVLLYIVIGFAGLPVFAGGMAGVAVLGQPSAGYLLSFPLAAFAAGLLARLLSGLPGPRYLWLFVSGIGAGIAVIHPLGILGLVLNAGMAPTRAILTDLIFWPGDVAKNLVAAGLALAVHKAFPDLALDRHRVAEATVEA